MDELLATVSARHGAEGAKLTLFWPMVGEWYELGRSLMLVGRAPNGWDVQWSSAEAADPKRRAEIVDSARRLGEWGFAAEPGHCPLAWVTDNAGEKDGYNTNRSAFWRAARDSVTRLYSDAVEGSRWSSYIAWTDLFKVAPAEAGNPSGPLQQTQLDICTELLRIEVETWHPARVLLFTGIDWAQPFLARLGVRATPYHGCLVEAAGIADGRRWAVAKHPQGKKQRDLVSQATAALGGAAERTRLRGCLTLSTHRSRGSSGRGATRCLNGTSRSLLSWASATCLTCGSPRNGPHRGLARRRWMRSIATVFGELTCPSKTRPRRTMTR